MKTKTLRIISISLLLLFSSDHLIGQNNCDTIIIGYSEFDKTFQREFLALQADTIFAMLHCPTSYGCIDALGLLFWKINNQLYFKYFRAKGNKIRIRNKVNTKIEKLLTQFLSNRMYEVTADIENSYFIDDGPDTFMMFKTPTNCWTYSHLNSKDKRVVWTEKLLSELK